MQTFPTTDNGACTCCGSGNMILAEDYTAYSPCTFDADTGKFERNYTGEHEPSGQEDAVRFFCTDCGARHAVPEELK